MRLQQRTRHIQLKPEPERKQYAEREITARWISKRPRLAYCVTNRNSPVLNFESVVSQRIIAWPSIGNGNFFFKFVAVLHFSSGMFYL